MRTGIEEWIEWVKQTPHPHVDWRDRFYLEQRLAGWLSSGMQSWDLTGLDHVSPINSSNAFALLLSVPVEKRAERQHQLELIRRMAPQLLEIPINPGSDYFNPLTRLYWRCQEDSLYPLKWIWKKWQPLLQK